MSLPEVIAGLVERFQTVAGIDLVLPYEPKALHVARAIYLILDRFERGQPGQVTTMRYVIAASLCVRWQDNEAAEQELVALINPVCAAIDADPRLGGRLERGLAAVTDGDAEYRDIGGTLYRVCTIYVEALEKAPVGSGI